MARKNNSNISARIAEIATIYYLGGHSWCKFKKLDKDPVRKIKNIALRISREEFDNQVCRAKQIVDNVKQWLCDNDYPQEINAIYWTADPDDLSKITGINIEKGKNPSDVLIEFKLEDGGVKLLGLSIKSREESSVNNFINTGITDAMKNLGILEETEIDIINGKERAFVSQNFQFISEYYDTKFKSRSEAKKYNAHIQITNPNLYQELKEIGNTFLECQRDRIFDRLNEFENEEAKQYLLEEWLRVGIYPGYIICAAIRSKDGLRIEITDPRKDQNTLNICRGEISFQKHGSTSIRVFAGECYIFSIRLKWDRRPFSSSVKFSGEIEKGVD